MVALFVAWMLQDYFNEEDDEDARRVPPRPSSPELHSEGVGRPFVKLRPGSPPSQRLPPRVSLLSHHLFTLHPSDPAMAVVSSRSFCFDCTPCASTTGVANRVESYLVWSWVRLSFTLGVKVRRVEPDAAFAGSISACLLM